MFITFDISDDASQKITAYAEDIHANGGITPELAANVKCMADWIGMALISHRNGSVLRERFGIYESFCYDDSFRIVFEQAEIPDEGEIRNAARPKFQQDTRILGRLRENFGFEYKGELTDAVTKFSVSDISKHGDSETVILARPAFANEDGFTAAEKGTAVHCFLQFADFEALQKDFESEKQRLISDFIIIKIVKSN